MANGQNMYVRKGVQLPVRQGPVRFAVQMPNGRTSNAWRVWTQNSDAYICCRDNMQETKISLHRSGKQHIAFTRESRIEMIPGSRFWNQWREPTQQSPAIPSFKLVFPSWGVQLNREDRSKSRTIRQKWDNNQILIEGDEELLTVVSFLVLDESSNLDLTGGNSATLIGVLPFRHGKSLFVVASKEPERNLKCIVEHGLAKVGPELAQKLLEVQEEPNTPVACLSGDNPEGYAFMVIVQVQAKVSS